MKPTAHTFGISPAKKYADSDIDPYSTAIVEDLIQGAEWRSISDIVRLSFKALTDVVRAQGESLKEMERQLPTRASKSELHTGLSLKANINDVSRTIAEVATSLDSKISFEDVQTVLKDHVLKSDLQYLLSNKVNIDEVRQIIERTAPGGGNEHRNEVEILKSRIDEFQKEVVKKIGSLPSLKEISQLTQAIELKANLQEVNEALETKASKQSVQSALAKKVNKQELEDKLQAYATIQDVQPLVDALEQKASLDQIEKVAQILEVKVDRADFTILINSVQSKADQVDLDQMKDIQAEHKLISDQRYAETLNKFESTRHDTDDLKNQLVNLMSKKVDVRELEKFSQSMMSKLSDNELSSSHLSQIRQDIYTDINRLRDEILSVNNVHNRKQMQTTILKSSHLSEKLTEELYNLSEQVRQIDEDRRNESEDHHRAIEDLRKIASKLTNIKKEQTYKLETLQEEMDNLKKFAEDAHQRFSLKKDYNDLKARILSLNDDGRSPDVHKLLQTTNQELQMKFANFKEEIKLEMKSMQTEVNQATQKKLNKLQNTLQQSQDSIDNQRGKPGSMEFEELKKIVHRICMDQDDRVTQKEFQQHIQFTKNVLDLIQKDMILKANIKDVCILIDSKANIEDVNIALTQIHKEVDNRASYEDLNNIVKKQAALNDSLCEENIIARFQWRSGDLRSGGAVPWEHQIINTLPDNYIWEKDKTSILTVAPGVYQIYYGFYAKRKPNIQVMVNGEPVITSFQQSQTVPSNSKIKDQLRHSSGNITGVTNIDFIVLPTRARISVVYDGEAGGEGFLGLKRL